ncbi:MAG TPA: hypothetical protein VOA87_17985, partial [Thermoanaerobaculia bacterium]|nr:hypothetical protein [Thermoanaerobaculia bacterium]
PAPAESQPLGPRRPWLLPAGAALGWTLLAAVFFHRLAGRALDDFFITYRYAWNLAAGNGFVFNPGERVFGTTEPGLGLLLALLHLATRIPIPTLGTLVFGAGMVGTAVVLLVEATERGRRAEALAGGTLALSSSYLWVSHGAAFPSAIFLLLLAALVAGRGQRGALVAGLLAGGAVWLRPDALAGVGLLGLLLWSERRRLPWGYGFAAGAVVAAGLAAAGWTFGAILPNTLLAKHAMAAAKTGSGTSFWLSTPPLLERHWGRLWAVIAALGIAGQWPLYRGMGRAGRLLVLFAFSLGVAYPLLGVPFFIWYTFPAAFAVLYGAAFFAGWAGRSIGRLAGGRRRWLAAAAGAALLLPLSLSLLPASCRWLRAYDWFAYLKTYRRAALFIHQRSAPEDGIAYVEIGVLSYYSRQPVLDLLGLVTPESLPFIARHDLVGAFLAHPTPWVVWHSRGRMTSIVERRWFPRAYEQVARFDDDDGAGWMAVYHRRPGTDLPPPRAPR